MHIHTPGALKAGFVERGVACAKVARDSKLLKKYTFFCGTLFTADEVGISPEVIERFL